MPNKRFSILAITAILAISASGVCCCILLAEGSPSVSAELQVIRPEKSGEQGHPKERTSFDSRSRRAAPRGRLTIRKLLRPHAGALAWGALAVIGETAANLLQPWPLKIVIDNVVQSKETHGWIL